MRLYAGPLSIFSRKVEIALAEKRLAYDRVEVPFSQTGGYSPRNPEVLAAHPKGQVPVLVDGQTTIYDSTVILEYLEDAYPAPPLYPTSPADRARCRVLEVYSDEIMVPALVGLGYRTEPGPRTTAAWIDREKDAVGITEQLRRSFAKLDLDLQGQTYLCGDHVTVADVAAFVAVFYVQRLGGPPTKDHSGLHNWFNRLCDRKPFADVTQAIIAADSVLSQPVEGAFLGHDRFL